MSDPKNAAQMTVNVMNAMAALLRKGDLPPPDKLRLLMEATLELSDALGLTYRAKPS
jgi:hypothetical protein